MAKLKSETNVITNPVRLSYASIWTPRSVNGSEPKYGTALLIPKEDSETIGLIEKAIDAAKAKALEKLGGKLPKGFKTPLKDGDDPDVEDEHYRGQMYVNANSRVKPGVVDLNLRPIEDGSEVYSGCWCRADVNFYYYDAGVNRGVGCGLNNLQKTKDDEAFSGRAKAEDAFDDGYLGDDDDFMG